MIAGCYTLDLYCDNDKSESTYPDRHGHEFREFPWQYTGEHGSDCRTRARKAGWVLHVRTGAAWCPKCSGKTKRCAPSAGTEGES